MNKGNEQKNMEYREVYTRDGRPTGRVREKHERIPGDFYLHTIVILKTDDSPAPGTGEGRYVMQQRSLKARFYTGRWDVTGGGVQAGETPRTAAAREAREELGLRVEPESLKLYHEYTVEWDDGTGLFISVFACRVHVPEDGIRFDPYEVNDAAVVPFSVFYTAVMDHNDAAFGDALKRIEREV